MTESNKPFPTGIYRSGNDLVFRLCTQDGKRKKFKHRFQPCLFLPAPPDTPVEVAEHFALRGEPDPRNKTPLVKRQFDNMYEMKQYLDENFDVPGVRLYGSKSPVIQAYSDFFPEDIKPNFKHIRCMNLDIEVVSSFEKDGMIGFGPFPEPIIEEEQYRSNSFNIDIYSDHVTEFYKWWNVEFPNSVIPIWTNMNAAFPIVSLQLSDKNLNKQIIWGLPLRRNRNKFVYNPKDEEISGLDVEYREFSTEQDMLKDFIKYWASRDPDLWTGWNISQFDAPYLAERVIKILGSDWVNSLSTIGRAYKKLEKPKKGLPYNTWVFDGVPAMPYDDLYRRHRLVERARYSLDFISHIELDEQKLSYAHVKSLNTLWFVEYENFIRYGIKDINLVDKLDAKLGYLNLTYMLAALYKCNYSETLSTVTPWSSLLYSFNAKKNRYPLLKRHQTFTDSFPGAFVHDPLPGRYLWLLSEDLNSLYPHIFQQYNLGPETIVTESERRDIIYEMIQEVDAFKTTDFQQNRAKTALLDALRNEREIINELVDFGLFEFQCLKDHGVSMTPNLQFFINDEISCYSVIMREKYATRKTFKKSMLKHEQIMVDLKTSGKKNSQEYHDADYQHSNDDTSQHGVKILLNAGYGAVGTEWLTEYFDPRIARATTASGEFINKWITKQVTGYLRDLTNEPNHRFVVYGDTDSCYITLEKLAKLRGWDKLERKEAISEVDKFEKEELKPFIEENCKRLADSVNAFEQRMFWGREVISIHGGIFQAKKRYCLLVDDSEGVHYETPKLKVTGLESKKSTTPEICVDWFETCYKLAILNKQEEIYEKVKEYRDIWNSQSPADIATASSCSNITKFMSNGEWVPIKNTPYQASSAMLHNRLISERGGRTPLIGDGSKLLLVVLKKNNPYNANYIAFQNFFPEELEDVKAWIDYEGLFEKNFLTPLDLLLGAVKMDHKKKVNVFSFIKKKAE